MHKSVNWGELRASSSAACPTAGTWQRQAVSGEMHQQEGAGRCNGPKRDAVITTAMRDSVGQRAYENALTCYVTLETCFASVTLPAIFQSLSDIFTTSSAVCFPNCFSSTLSYSIAQSDTLSGICATGKGSLIVLFVGSLCQTSPCSGLLWVRQTHGASYP